MCGCLLSNPRLSMLSKWIKSSSYIIAASLLCIICILTDAYAAQVDERRVRSGLKQFKSVLAADKDLSRKQTIDGSLQILLVYTNDQQKAQILADEFSNKGKGSKAGTIRKMSVKTKVVEITELADYLSRRVAGVYLTQPLSAAKLEALVKFGVDKRLVVYSPFEGDVYRGVFVGMSIGTRVYPLINLDTMKASRLRIKSFFLRIAKKYES